MRDLLTRSFSATPANQVGLTVHTGPRTPRIHYTECRPVATRSGGEAELRAVRHLVRRGGGDLRLHAAPEGDSLELTLPTAPRPPDPIADVRDHLVEENV